MWTPRHRLVTRVGALQRESDRMAWEPISPELALVDPELGARARAALADPAAATYAPRPSPVADRDATTGASSVSVLGAGHRGAVAARSRNPRRRRSDPARAGHSTRRSPGRGRTLLPSARRDAGPASATRPVDARERPPADALLAARRPSEPRLQSGALGAIAQLGERLDRTQEVASSSLASSMAQRPRIWGRCCFGGGEMSPSGAPVRRSSQVGADDAAQPTQPATDANAQNVCSVPGCVRARGVLQVQHPVCPASHHSREVTHVRAGPSPTPPRTRCTRRCWRRQLRSLR